MSRRRVYTTDTATKTAQGPLRTALLRGGRSVSLGLEDLWKVGQEYVRLQG
jgi:hypothetical protein